MAALRYTAICSLDGFVADREGGFEWAAPDEEVHAYVNDLERDVGTCLLGRRMYETMVFWENVDLAGEPEVMHDYAEIWRAAEKVVYSRTLGEVGSERTRLEREFDPAAVASLKAEAERDLSIGGAGLAAEAFAAGLIDEIHLILIPVLVGGGTATLPAGQRLDLELIDSRRFAGGAVAVGYRVNRSHG